MFMFAVRLNNLTVDGKIHATLLRGKAAIRNRRQFCKRFLSDSRLCVARGETAAAYCFKAVNHYLQPRSIDLQFLQGSFITLSILTHLAKICLLYTSDAAD